MKPFDLKPFHLHTHHNMAFQHILLISFNEYANDKELATGITTTFHIILLIISDSSISLVKPYSSKDIMKLMNDPMEQPQLAIVNAMLKSLFFLTGSR